MSLSGSYRTHPRLRKVLAEVSQERLSTRLCSAAPRIVGVDSAGVTLSSPHAIRVVVTTSDAQAAEVESLQLDLGQGPSVVAANTRRMVLVPDLEVSRDPALAIYASRLSGDTDIRAVFCFPIFVGVTPIGALDLFRTTPGSLSPEGVEDACLVAELLGSALLDEGAGAIAAGREPDWLAVSPDSRAAVHLATGVLMVQLEIGPTEASARIRAHAFGASRWVADVARDILDHTLFLEP